MKHYILIGVAAVCGLLAFFLTHQHLEKLQKQYGRDGAKITVVVARKSVIAGNPLTYEDLTVYEIMEKNRTNREIVVNTKEDPKGSATIRRLLGLKVFVDVPPGAPILTTYLDVARESGSFFAGRIPEQKRAVTLNVDNVSGVANLIRPNDHIDILGTFRFPSQTPEQPYDMVTVTMLENVIVLAVDQLFNGSQQGVGRSYGTVTVSVDPELAELLVFAQEKGKLTLTLRNPKDVLALEDVRKVDFDYLYRRLQVEKTDGSRQPSTP